MLAHRHRKLCWDYNRYDKLPCNDGEEEECQVSMTYPNGFGYEDDLGS